MSNDAGHYFERYEFVVREVMKRRGALLNRLARRFPDVCEAWIESCFADAVLDWCSKARESGITSPEVPSMRVFYWPTRRRIMDFAASERSRRARESAWVSENRPEAHGLCTDGEVGSRRELVASEICEQILGLLPDDRMRTVCRLRAAGEKRTQEYASALGIERLARHQQIAEVQREKDRFRQFCRRNPAIRKAAGAFLDYHGELPETSMSNFRL